MGQRLALHLRSILVPLTPSEGNIRKLDVAGDTARFQSLLDTLGKVQRVKYEVEYASHAVAEQKGETARKEGDLKLCDGD